MKLVCLIKYIAESDRVASGAAMSGPDGRAARYTINPDDACALAYALNVKKARADVKVELVTVSTKAALPLLEDAVRLGVDHATIILDQDCMGNDAAKTARLLTQYLSEAHSDCILTGSQSLDGGSGAVPPLVAEVLELPQLSFVNCLNLTSPENGKARAQLIEGRWVADYEVGLPAVLGLSASSGYRLPFIRLKDKKRSVSDQVRLLEAEDLSVAGGVLDWPFEGRTQQVDLQEEPLCAREQRVVSLNPQGMEIVVSFLKEKKFI